MRFLLGKYSLPAHQTVQLKRNIGKPQDVDNSFFWEKKDPFPQWKPNKTKKIQSFGQKTGRGGAASMVTSSPAEGGHRLRPPKHSSNDLLALQVSWRLALVA